jgi:hypothetical protein
MKTQKNQRPKWARASAPGSSRRPAGKLTQSPDETLAGRDFCGGWPTVMTTRGKSRRSGADQIEVTPGPPRGRGLVGRDGPSRPRSSSACALASGAPFRPPRPPKTVSIFTRFRVRCTGPRGRRAAKSMEARGRVRHAQASCGAPGWHADGPEQE